MMNFYYREGEDIRSSKNLEVLRKTEKKTILWVDLLRATREEKDCVEDKLDIELFTRQESEEIESSSKYAEDQNEVGINMNFLTKEDNEYVIDPVSFILKGHSLVTQRNAEFKTFTDALKKTYALKAKRGSDVLLNLLETRIDYDADLIEIITERITKISQKMIKEYELERDQLLRITALQETTILIRENIIEKQRILSSILKSNYFPEDNYEKIRIMIKDVGSLLDHASFNFERLEFLQNTFLGLVDMEQNRIIKIFTVVTVIFMPPTLIASMYGMNFEFMPELDERYGYPMAIGMMLVSSALTLLFFKRKKWL
jgi:magnesium transporter